MLSVTVSKLVEKVVHIMHQKLAADIYADYVYTSVVQIVRYFGGISGTVDKCQHSTGLPDFFEAKLPIGCKK